MGLGISHKNVTLEINIQNMNDSVPIKEHLLFWIGPTPQKKKYSEIVAVA